MLDKVFHYLSPNPEVSDELRRAKEKEKALTDQVDSLRGEVVALSTFLDTHNFSDSSEILAEFDKINNLVYDVACTASYDEAWAPNLAYPKRLDRNPNAAKTTLSRAIVNALARYDVNSSSGAGTTLLQYAFQSCMIKVVHNMLGEFCCGAEPSLNQVTKEMAYDVHVRGEWWLSIFYYLLKTYTRNSTCICKVAVYNARNTAFQGHGETT